MWGAPGGAEGGRRKRGVWSPESTSGNCGRAMRFQSGSKKKTSRSGKTGLIYYILYVFKTQVLLEARFLCLQLPFSSSKCHSGILELDGPMGSDADHRSN